MTAEALSSLPFQAGSAIAASAGRLALWGFGRYMQAPLRNTGVAALVGFSALAASNALYFQAHRHPAPLFGVATTFSEIADETARPVVPATRHLSTLPLVPRTPVVSLPPPVPAIGNDEVFQVQRKLQAFKLFDTTVDGLFGPRTSKAIRSFEEQQGLAPKGELTREIVDLIIATPITAEPPKIQQLVAPEPLPAAANPRTMVEPVAAADPLPTASIAAAPKSLSLPEPLPLLAPPGASAALEPAEAAPALQRQIPGSPEEALNMVADTAGDAIDTIINGVQTMTMSRPNASNVPKRIVQTIPITAPAAPAAETLKTAALSENAGPAATDPIIVAKVQRGLSSLGFLHGAIDGVAGEATAKAIRNFEVYYNYDVTGRISRELVDLLVQNGAVI